MMIGIVDYGSGNFASVFNAVNNLTPQIHVIRTPYDFDKVTHIILPGVGAFSNTMQKLENLNLVRELENQVITNKKPYLGICVGMQILGETGYEFGVHEGLGWIRSSAKLLNNKLLPHMGWNEVNIHEEIKILKGIEDKSTFYFVHSYGMDNTRIDKDTKVAFTDYSQKFVSVIEKDNIFGVQFHPEKSQDDGLKLLYNFISLGQ